LFWVARGFADQLSGFFGRHGQRLFADDMFAGAQRSEGLRGVFLIGRGNVNDIDFRRINETLVIVIKEYVPDIPFGCNFTGAIGTGDGGDADAEALEGFDVDWANEA